MKAKQVILDANVILRFLLADNEAHFDAAKTLFQTAKSGKIKLVLLPVIFMEVYFVLFSFYKLEKLKILPALEKFLLDSSITCSEAEILLHTLELAKSYSLSLPDLYLASYAKLEEKAIASFDKEFRPLKEIEWINPLGD